MTQFMSNSIFFGAAISLIAYEAGLFLKRKFKMAIFNPLLIAIIAVMAVLSLLHIDYDTYNQSGQYIQLSAHPCDCLPGSSAVSADRTSGKRISKQW
ncbi:MAG: LrgB family protein [Blautia wexlerae]